MTDEASPSGSDDAIAPEPASTTASDRAAADAASDHDDGDARARTSAFAAAVADASHSEPDPARAALAARAGAVRRAAAERAGVVRAGLTTDPDVAPSALISPAPAADHDAAPPAPAIVVPPPEAAIPSPPASTGGGAHLHTVHDREDRGDRDRPRLGTARLGALLLVAALVGGIVGGLVTAAGAGLLRGGPSTVTQPVLPMTGAHDDSAEIAAAAAFAAPSVVSLRIVTETRSEVGSGIVLSADGAVLTNAHVITLDGTVTNAQITATSADGRVFQVDTVGIDVLADLAVVRLRDVTDLVPATFADSSALALGQRTIVLGSPLGLAGTTTSGIVSTVHRSIQVASAEVPPSTDTTDDGPGPTPGTDSSKVQLAVFQTDADINPGNSGGPVVNARGEVIGVSVAIATTKSGQNGGPASDGSIGLGFAIPSNEAIRVSDELLAGRVPSHGALGATLKSADRVTTSTQATVGAYIDDLIEGGPAQRAGVRRGDVVTAIDGIEVRSAVDLLALVRCRPGGETVTLTLSRQGDELDAEVQLDASPS